MKKEFFVAVIAFAALALAVFPIYGFHFKSNSLFEQNIEALARQEEQPDVDKCIADPEFACVALHPTDPSKDVYRPDARW